MENVEMFKMDGMRNSEEDKIFEQWTKELEKELSNFWHEFINESRRT